MGKYLARGVLKRKGCRCGLVLDGSEIQRARNKLYSELKFFGSKVVGVFCCGAR